MAALEAAKTRGWSYNVGYSHEYRSSKPRFEPVYNVRQLRDCVSGWGKSIEEAALNCAANVARRESDPSDWKRDDYLQKGYRDE